MSIEDITSTGDSKGPLDEVSADVVFDSLTSSENSDANNVIATSSPSKPSKADSEP